MAAFVGRSEELVRLSELARAAARDLAPKAALITGPPGSGKSRLLAEARGVDEFDRVLTAAGHEPEREVSFAAGLGLLRALTDAGEEGMRLATMLGSTSPTGALEPLRLFETASRALAQMSHPLLVVDDLHWVDPSTIALVHYLMRAALDEGRPVVLFAASRPAPQSAALASSIERALGAEATLRIGLDPLDAEAGTALAATLMPKGTAEEARAVWERAEGSPFWIELLATDPGGSKAPRAASLRLEGLGRDAASLVSALTVAGRPLTLPEIAGLLGWPEDRAAAAVAEAVARGAAMESVAAVRLAHDLIREAALQQIPAETIRTLHGRLAETLEAAGARDDVVRLYRALEHARAAGRTGMALALRLARSPRRRLLGIEGMRSLAVVAEESSDAPDAAGLGFAVAELASELGDHAFALERWQEMVERPAGTSAALAAIRGAKAAFHTGEGGRAHALLARVPPVTDPVLAVERDSVDATIRLWLTGDAGGGHASAARAVEAARRVVAESGGVASAPVEVIHAYREALNVAFESKTIQGQEEAAWELAQEIGTASRTEEEQLDAEMTIGGHLRRAGRWSDAEGAFRRVWSRAHADALPELMMGSGYRLASVLLARGRLDEAEEVAAECDALGRRIGGLSWTRAWFHADWFGTAHHRGDWHSALRDVEKRASAEPHPHYRSGLTTHLLRWEARLAGAGSAGDVAHLIEQCHTDIKAAGCERCAKEFTVTAAEAYARVGLIEQAEAELRGSLEHTPAASETALMRLARAEGLIALGRDPDEGTDVLREVVERAEGLGLAVDALWGQLDLAAALTKASRPDEATERYRDAAEAADRMGAVTEGRIAQQGLRALGIRTWRRTREADTGPSLTERERQIAELVATGASNPEIASTLFLSRKTVERHISNILAKLGARNRTELAGLISTGDKE